MKKISWLICTLLILLQPLVGQAGIFRTADFFAEVIGDFRFDNGTIGLAWVCKDTKEISVIETHVNDIWTKSTEREPAIICNIKLQDNTPISLEIFASIRLTDNKYKTFMAKYRVVSPDGEIPTHPALRSRVGEVYGVTEDLNLKTLALTINPKWPDSNRELKYYFSEFQFFNSPIHTPNLIDEHFYVNVLFEDKRQ